MAVISDYFWTQKQEPMVINIKMQDCIAQVYDDILKDILKHSHVHYVFPGGRGIQYRRPVPGAGYIGSF